MLQFLPVKGSSPTARKRSVRLAAAAATIASLAVTGAASAAIVQLPPGGQVNDDAPAGIDAHQDAGASDVVGGSLVAGGVNVPWATFEQQTGSSRQIFVRAFKNGAWKTQGSPASLNIDPHQEAEEPSIDFAGAGRTVPWVSWYEPNDNLPGGATNIFASRFTAATNVWTPEGQDRTSGHRIPSLNIHTDRDAVDPAVAGGVAAGAPAGAAPVPWVAWQERDGGAANDDSSPDQIFVSRGIKQTDCSANAPGSNPSVSQFCWQQTGIKRLGATSGASDAAGDPTLNIDPTRKGVEPDIAFTGPGDGVPWIVWYEKDAGSLGLSDKEQVFAAKAVRDATADGGFRYIAVGNGTTGKTNVLDRSAGGFGACAASIAAERECALNADPGRDAEDPRVATGTLTPGGITVPWVAWSEDTGSGRHGIFVSRLVGGDHFALFNGGNPISSPSADATDPDITFSGNVPYVSWHETYGTEQHAFSGHFEGGATASRFVLDTPGGLPNATEPGLRAPISSACTANPFTADGASCPGGAAGSPFLLRTTAESPHRLLAAGHTADAVETGGATAVTTSSATVTGTIWTGGGPINAHFEFGTTPQYGNSTAVQRLNASSTTLSVSSTSELHGLAPGTTIHYRLVGSGDFGTVAGADRTFTTASYPSGGGGGPTHAGHVAIGGAKLHLDRHRVVKVRLSCPAGESRCRGTLKIVVHGHVIGRAPYSIAAGHHATIKVHLSRRSAVTLLRSRHARLQAGSTSRTVAVSASR